MSDASPPRRCRRMSQRLPGEQQAAPPGQVGAGRGGCSADLPPLSSVEGRGTGQPPRHREGRRAGGPAARSVLLGGVGASEAEAAAPALQRRGGRRRGEEGSPPPHGPVAAPSSARERSVLRPAGGKGQKWWFLRCPLSLPGLLLLRNGEGRAEGEYPACLHGL